MKQTLLDTQLSNLCDKADKDISILSDHIYEFIYRVMSNYSYLESEGYYDIDEWREEFKREADNILAIINPENSIDIHYLISVKTIITGENFVCASSKMMSGVKFNYN